MAATKKLRSKQPGIWLVPSQTGFGDYTVNVATEEFTCSCPDFEIRQQPCKHIFAVAYTVVREQKPDGTVTETTTITAVKKTYPQNWRQYNTAQTTEQDRFQVLLHDLCCTVSTPMPKTGRPPLPFCDAIFSATYKVYSTVSQRRFMSDLREAHERGFIAKVPHFNTISNTLESAELTPILQELIAQSSLPLKSVEVDFAVDSSGFTSSRFVRWFDHKYGTVRQKHEWVKVHLMCGVKTNVVTAVEIGDKYAGDSPFLTPLLQTTAKNFSISEVSADKGYISAKNMEAIAATGATPFIPFRKGQTAKPGGLWEKMFYFFNFHKEEFLERYHKRSNIESTFSAIKRKFGDGLRSKTDTAMVNESLCKILCHNLVVLIHEIQELDINVSFCTKTQEAAQEGILN
ncbi:MAG TPA: transposase [Terriglobales bacterium]|nr:transposase [Terriglobales bacterium]